MATHSVEVPQSLVHEIGETAGQVWHALEQHGELRLAALQKKVGVPTTLLHLALGWLAREDKIEITPDGRSFRARLR